VPPIRSPAVSSRRRAAKATLFFGGGGARGRAGWHHRGAHHAVTGVTAGAPIAGGIIGDGTDEMRWPTAGTDRTTSAGRVGSAGGAALALASAEGLVKLRHHDAQSERRAGVPVMVANCGPAPAGVSNHNHESQGTSLCIRESVCPRAKLGGSPCSETDWELNHGVGSIEPSETDRAARVSSGLEQKTVQRQRRAANSARFPLYVTSNSNLRCQIALNSHLGKKYRRRGQAFPRRDH